MELLIAISLCAIGILPIIYVGLRHRWILAPLLFSLALRIITATVHRYIWKLPQGTGDARVFDRMGLEWATQYGCFGFFEHFNPSASYVYSSVLATFYGCLDYSQYGAQILNVLTGTYGIAFLGLICNTMWGKSAARYVSFILAMFPFLIIYSSVELRESFIFMLFSAAIYSFVRYWPTRFSGWLLVAIILILLASLFHGAMALAIGGIIISLSLKPLLARSRNKQDYIYRLVIFCTLLFFVAGMSYLFYDKISLHKVGDISELDVEEVSELAEHRAMGDAAYLTGMSADNIFDFTWQAPIRMAYFLFSPFPWDVRSVEQVTGLVDSLAYLFMTVVFIKHRKKLMQNPVVTPLLIIIFILTFAFAFGTSNFGTAIRHREKFYLLMLVIIAPTLLHGRWRKSA